MPLIVAVCVPPEKWWRGELRARFADSSSDLGRWLEGPAEPLLEVELPSFWGLEPLERHAAELALRRRLLPPHPFDVSGDRAVLAKYADRLEQDRRLPFQQLLHAKGEGLYLPVARIGREIGGDLEDWQVGSSVGLGDEVSELSTRFESASDADGYALERLLCEQLGEACRLSVDRCVPLYFRMRYDLKPPDVRFGYEAASYCSTPMPHRPECRRVALR